MIANHVYKDRRFGCRIKKQFLQPEIKRQIIQFKNEQRDGVGEKGKKWTKNQMDISPRSRQKDAQRH
jgi:hypothetical protein